MIMRVDLEHFLRQMLLCSAAVLLNLGALVEATTTSSQTVTPSPAFTLDPAATPSPSSTPAPSIVPTPAPESSSSSSTSRGTVIAWALFTIAVSVALLVLLYSREQSRRRRILPRESLRRNFTTSGYFQPGYDQDPALPGHDEREPTMSSF